MLTAGFQKFTAAFWLSQKIGNILFRLKIRMLQNLSLNVWQETLVISLSVKKWKNQFTTTVN